ncbi:MAG: hypothetical protein LBR66_03520 [Candidatus Symbiothrix sp.]|jgi:long-subunit fatty acid transport protein|nr:hypothetical protein [Candidatus Symbiothrix sp.]
MKKILFTALVGLCACGMSLAQGELDAFRLSSTDMTGTARGQAMGGAFGALGGDATGVAINPAGLGVYRSSEVSSTLDYSAIHTKSDEAKSSTATFNFNNISYVGYFPIYGESLRTVNFGFAYNRVKNFERKYFAHGSNIPGSISDFIANSASENSLIIDLAYHGWIVDEDPSGNGYTGLFHDETTSPDLELSEKGSIVNYDFSLGFNLLDQWYFGGTLTVSDIFYQSSIYYTEGFQKGGYINWDTYNNETRGSGYQLKLGAIWRPIDELRLGIAFHSPTWTTLTHYYDAATKANYMYADGTLINQDNHRTFDPNDYYLSSPQRWIFSGAYIFGSKAIFSLDYEIKNYAQMKLRDIYYYPLEEDNRVVKRDYAPSSTLRAGLEYRFTSRFSGRLGYSWVQQPYTEKYREAEEIFPDFYGTDFSYEIGGDKQYFTAGLGYRISPEVSLDLAVVYRTQNGKYYYYPNPYDDLSTAELHNFASIKNTAFTTLLTFGYKF